MSTEDRIIQAVLGDPNYVVSTTHVWRQLGRFRYARGELPAGYKQGFPPTWDFAVLSRQETAITEAQQQDILTDAVTLIRDKSTKDPSIPLLIISEEPTILLGNELPYNEPRVFYIDATEIPPPPRRATTARYSPLMMAIRRHLSERDVHAMFLSPYLRNKPALSWRFFGRRRELAFLLGSQENFVIVGGRRIGKTSLLQQAKQRFSDAGYAAFYVDVQDCSEEGQVVGRILEELDVRTYASAMRRQKLVGDHILQPVLKKISARGHSVLLLDEIGNVISRSTSEPWRVFGTLRRFAQTAGLKIIMTSFQDFFLRQQNEPGGPLVNFATTMRLGGFTDEDIRDLVLGPLDIWGDISDRRALMDLVLAKVGRHPLFLQHFCSGVFYRILADNKRDVVQAARDTVTATIKETFAEAVEEVFYRARSSTLRYLFLKRCKQADLKNEAISGTIIDDDWLEQELSMLGFRTSSSGRRNMLEGLEVRGFTEAVAYDRGRQRIVSPVIYFFIKASNDIERHVAKYRQEIVGETTLWEMTKVEGPAA